MKPFTIRKTVLLCVIALSAAFLAGCASAPVRGTGDMGVIVERASGMRLDEFAESSAVGDASSAFDRLNQ